MECTVENKKLVTLSSAVKAAIVDKYADIGKVQQRFQHWGSREYKEIYMQVLPKLKHKVWLPVNSNTKTATLPLDFYRELYIGFIDQNWRRHPLKLNDSITDTTNVLNIPCENPCPKCNQDTSICNDLTVTEETDIIILNGQPYNETTVKKLYPNGDYYLEVTSPSYDLTEDEIIYTTRKEFITAFDLKPCGCLDTTPLNTDNLRTYCPDIYCSYYAPCESRCNNTYGGYKIFEESGLIQMDNNYPFATVYVEYYGFIQKIKGQYFIPQVCFETIVEGIKYRAIKNKDNEPRWRILDQKEEYRQVKGNMYKVMNRASLERIVMASMQLPKFDIDFGYDYYSCFNSAPTYTVPATSSNVNSCAAISDCCTTVNKTITINNGLNYTLAVIANGNPGEPVEGESTYQNDLLIGASGVEWILLAKQVLTLINGDFSINYTSGTVSISPSVFVGGDSLIVNYNKTS